MGLSYVAGKGPGAFQAEAGAHAEYLSNSEFIAAALGARGHHRMSASGNSLEVGRHLGGHSLIV